MIDSNNKHSSEISELTERELKFAYWFTTHKNLFRKIFIILLLVINVGFWSYVLFGFIKYAVEISKYEQMVYKLSWDVINYPGFHERNRPRDLQITAVNVIVRGEYYDLITRITNPNDKWFAEFDYKFSFTGGKTNFKKGFILPSEEKFLVDLGIESQRKPVNVNIELSNIKWKKIGAPKMEDYEEFSKKRLDFVIKNIEFIPGRALAVGEKLPISRVTFDATNNTAYSYWNVGFYILLYRGESLVGVNFISIDQFISGETRNVEMSWFERLPTVTKVKVFPEVNIFDPEVYMRV